MTVQIDLAPPARALAIGAHPDDIEFGCGATLAKWAAAGTEITLCICTDGAKGTWNPDADAAALVAEREAEQRDAAKILGATFVVFLRWVDGELEATLGNRQTVCRVIRDTRPEVVLAHDPWQPYRLHPDHHAAGMLAIGGIVAARDAHFYPEQQLTPHRPDTLLLFEPGRVDHIESVDGYLDTKADALLAHRSQWQSTMGIHADPDAERAQFVGRLHDEARAAGLRAGVREAEAFARLDDL
jgi:LmbE family N-acetylglucosaminyl deacetylase